MEKQTCKSLPLARKVEILEGVKAAKLSTTAIAPYRYVDDYLILHTSDSAKIEQASSRPALAYRIWPLLAVPAEVVEAPALV
ncbi:hypothetical protein HPB47_012647 [Ixodes persulcatus]|uniref:Uncharacterized protein n=1 Tax=Ixodes persulcatus TaxID=34615 RepID=A0AC60NSW1_IXOPE|nr:hypothetical protein HPB47_012647 [Ixodes persulcatus]